MTTNARRTISGKAARSGKPSRRAPGRPSADGADRRAELLDAAISCFARDGIAATSLRAVARQAGVTPAMVHYYFGDKAQLQQALVAERVLPATQQIGARLAAVGDDAGAAIAAFVHAIDEVVARHPWLPALWVREVLCEGGALREVLFGQLLPGLPEAMARRFAAAQRLGRIGADLDPRLLVVSLVGLTLFPAASAPIWKRALVDGIDTGPPVDRARMLRHTLSLLAHGIGAQ
ncbi:MAG: TetR/AcrR family transcriptional regulator [Proteobacteria bacterium]|nr:TetR/AcrR family transcriptional regulator [Pseudomonadota bacterium]